MNFKMQKANLLADNINDFIQYVYKSYENKDSSLFNRDKLYQIKLFLEEYKFQILADELKRINRFEWDEKYTRYLVKQIVEAMGVIEEYVKRNKEDLFMLTGRIYTLKNLGLEFE